jgi:hypothetical protein
MDMNSIILVGAICIVIGFLVYLLIRGLNGDEKIDNTEIPRESVLKAWREPDKDDLIIEIEGKEFRRSVNLNSKQRIRLNDLILELNDWLVSAPIKKFETDDQVPLAKVTPDQDHGDVAKPKLNFNPVTMLVNALQADIPKSQLPVESIVSQIDAVLQEKIKNSPLAGEPIRLMELTGRGMVVMIGLDQYDTVDDVPGGEIKEMIHSAVKEWERRGIEIQDNS